MQLILKNAKPKKRLLNSSLKPDKKPQPNPIKDLSSTFPRFKKENRSLASTSASKARHPPSLETFGKKGSMRSVV